jgi:hypothetical protein
MGGAHNVRPSIRLTAVPANNLRQSSWINIDGVRPECRMGIKISSRTSANINGALIVIGLLGTVDNVLLHWILGLHRLIDGSEYTLHAEILLVFASTLILAIGIYREWSARQRISTSKTKKRDPGSASPA